MKKVFIILCFLFPVLLQGQVSGNKPAKINLNGHTALIDPKVRVNVAFEGNSLTARPDTPGYIPNGSGGFNGPFYGFPNPWPMRLRTALQADPRFIGWKNGAVSGDWIDSATGMLNPIEKAQIMSYFDSTADYNVLFLWGGLNNIHLNQDAVTTYARIKELSQYYISNGWIVILFTEESTRAYNDTISAVFWSRIQTLNSSLLSGFNTDIGALKMVNIQSNPPTSGYDAPKNTFYYRGDGVHLDANANISLVPMTAAPLYQIVEGDLTPEIINYEGYAQVKTINTVDKNTLSIEFFRQTIASKKGFGLITNSIPQSILSSNTSSTVLYYFSINDIKESDTISISYNSRIGNTKSDSTGLGLFSFSSFIINNTIIDTGLLIRPITFPNGLGGSTSDTYKDGIDWKTSSTDAGFGHSRLSDMVIPIDSDGVIYIDPSTFQAGIGFKDTAQKVSIFGGLEYGLFIDQLGQLLFLDVEAVGGVGLVDADPFTTYDYRLAIRKASSKMVLERSDDGWITVTDGYVFGTASHTSYFTKNLSIVFDLLGDPATVLSNPRIRGAN